jgi:hypothetical protein
LWHYLLEEPGDIVPVLSVAIADPEEVRPFGAAEIRCDNERILVLWLRHALHLPSFRPIGAFYNFIEHLRFWLFCLVRLVKHFNGVVARDAEAVAGCGSDSGGF